MPDTHTPQLAERDAIIPDGTDPSLRTERDAIIPDSPLLTERDAIIPDSEKKGNA
ncbi:hypothetical protein [Pseudalkalibacillus sp. SCS-8]|uniref:hypothetical protein n=1 Tax=Pseudalkalibacillus nanhaiensis TaxID=3115291 RepID=UPI0032DB5C04